MSVKPISLFFLLSLALGHSAWCATDDKAIIKTEDQSPQAFPNEEAYDNLSISETPSIKNLPKPKKPYIFLYESSLGFYSGIAHLVDAEEQESAIGIVYDIYDKDGDAYEYSFNAFGGDGRFEAGKKYLENNTGRFRWHYGWLVGLTVDADKGLANLVNFKKLLFGGMAGYEHIFFDPFSFRNDFKILLGKDEVYLQINAYLVFSW